MKLVPNSIPEPTRLALKQLACCSKQWIRCRNSWNKSQFCSSKMQNEIFFILLRCFPIWLFTNCFEKWLPSANNTETDLWGMLLSKRKQSEGLRSWWILCKFGSSSKQVYAILPELKVINKKKTWSFDNEISNQLSLKAFLPHSSGPYEYKGACRHILCLKLTHFHELLN